MIVNLKDVLQYAEKNNCCIPAINVYNLETIEGTLKASYKMDYPIIIQFGESYLEHATFNQIVNLIKYSKYNKDNLIVIHLDHAQSTENIFNAISSGFTSVMYDGSSLDFETNVNNTRNIVEYAHQRGVSVEAELGYLNEEDGDGEVITEGYTSVFQTKVIVEKTGIDALAVAIGNAHGIYKGVPNLDFDRLKEINKNANVPIVLHGTSGIPELQIQKAISLGVRKINVNTEVAVSASLKAREILTLNKMVRFNTLILGVEDKITSVVKQYIDICMN